MPSSDVPRVSVIIPCFNYGRFLKTSLASVTGQTLKPVETLIIDDGSTDPDTLAILHDLSVRGTKIIRQENRGLSGARNTGVRQSKGEFIYFLDADDVLFPECLEKLATLLQQDSNAIAACCGVKLLGGQQNGTEWPARYDPYLILVENIWGAGIMLQKRRIEELSLYYDEAMRNGYEDWEFNIRLVQTGQPILVHPAPLYHYRIHPHSMLASSRTRHAELVAYIRRKHGRLFAAENLLKLKGQDFPALAVSARAHDKLDTEPWLARQTFKDYVAAKETNTPRHWLLQAGGEASNRLPSEAIECAIMFLETNKIASACTLAVRLHGNDSFLGSTWKREMCQPVAIVAKTEAWATLPPRDKIVSFDNLIRFADQLPGSTSGWQPLEFNIDAKRKWHLLDLVSTRKLFRLKLEKLFGARIKNSMVGLYDLIYYRVLLSASVLSVRNKVAGFLGERGEIILSRIFYGAFLAVPPPKDPTSATPALRHHNPDPSPLFLDTDTDTSKITLLIITAWLNQGGVEQEILDLCTYLDRSRFRIIIATTRRSSHPWENRFRSTGASVYHLADIFSPDDIQRGLAHLILQHGVDVTHIVHSREAYASLPFIKRLCPFVSVCDRNVIMAGNFPKISARLKPKLVDVRTVGHHKLAKQMSAYGLSGRDLKVIYAGTDPLRLQRHSSDDLYLLHSLCGVSSDVPIVLYVGRLDREKRPEIFVRVAARVCKLRPDCPTHFAMAGDGEMRGKTEALIAKLRLHNRIHLLGFQTNGPYLIKDSAVLMITSRHEGLALVSFEAIAMCTPQISADVGSQSELVTPDIGILIKNGIGEVDRYARACIEILADRERRESMSAACKRKYTDQYSAQHCAHQYGRIFEELAELSRRRAVETPCLRPPHINPLNAFG